MSWAEKYGYWSRPFDCHDTLFQLLCSIGDQVNREHWLLMINAKINFSAQGTPGPDDIVAQLQKAWKALRFRHPDIALEILEKEKRYYPIRDYQALEAWCNETFRIETTSLSADEFFSRQHRSEPHATLHWFPATSQVALISSHVRWDGRGSLLMLHELLSALEHPTLPTVFDGSEANNLVPALGTVIGMPEDIKPEWEKSAAEIFQPFIDAQPSLGLLPSGDLRAELGNTKRVEIVFSSDRSKALREAARTQGLSISSAVQTAAIMALSFVNDPDSQPENFASWTPTDLRKYCPQPFDGPVHAPSLRVGGFPLIVKSRGSWSEISQATSKLNKTSWDMKDNDLMFIREPYVRISIAMFEAAITQSELQPSTDPMLSGLGILDDYIKHQYGSVVVEDVSTMVQIAAPSICFHYWSWNGELHLSANYNVAHYNKVYIQKYLDATKDIMVENLQGKDAV